MSLITEVLGYVGNVKIFSEVFLVAGAPPRVRELEELRNLVDTVLTPRDTRGFLIYLRELAGKFGPLDKRGVFTVSSPDFGRVRVVYGTQRGSYYLSLLKIPAEIPSAENYLLRAEKFEKLFKLVANAGEMVFVVFGEDWFVNATFIYSLFKKLTEGERKVIMTLENPPAYLLKHGSSVVVQKEIYVDNKDIVEGVEDIPLINPDYVYTFDVLNIYSLPLEEILRYITGRVNLFLNFPMRSKTLLRKFLSDFMGGGREFVLIRLYQAGLGLYDFQIE